MTDMRQIIDFSLKRKHVLDRIRIGMVPRTDYQDADYFLVEAAKNYGVKSASSCPICDRSFLFEVSWIYGDSLKKQSGTARTPAEILDFAENFPEFTVHVVEVCKLCNWNYLLYSYRAGFIDENAATKRNSKVLKG